MSENYFDAMMTPTLENLPLRLREGDDLTSRMEAADEIERLRADYAGQQALIDRLQVRISNLQKRSMLCSTVYRDRCPETGEDNQVGVHRECPLKALAQAVVNTCEPDEWPELQALAEHLDQSSDFERGLDRVTERESDKLQEIGDRLNDASVLGDQADDI